MTGPGIVDAAAYVPAMRLDRQAIFAANSWANPALKGLARGARSMCNWDEDSITMGVEAARRCLSDRPKERLRRLYFASTTPPFADRQSAAVVGEALNLAGNLAAVDLANSRNAGLQAPDELILVAGFAQGGIALLLRTTGKLPEWQERNARRAALSPPRPERAYTKYLSFSGLLPMDFGMRAEADAKTRLSAFDRHRAELTGFIGGRCPVCGTVQFPRSARCVNPDCNAEAEQEPVPLAEQPGEVSSFTQDWLAYTPHPPLQYGLAATAEGARVLMEFTECPLERMRVGLKLRFVFRIHAIDSQRGYRRYFWKGAPAPGEERA